MTSRLLTCVCVAGLAVPVVASYKARTDGRVVALDLRTGKLIWEHVPEKLQTAHLELYREGLMVRDYQYPVKPDPWISSLDPAKGNPISRFDLAADHLLAKSPTFLPPSIRLSNGWELSGYQPGNSKELVFTDPKTKTEAWRIKAGGYPFRVAAMDDTVFYAFGTSQDDGIYARPAGSEKPVWEVHLNQLVTGSDAPVRRIAMQLIEGVIYVECGEAKRGNNHHLLAFDARNGKVLWHRDLVKELGVRLGSESEHWQDRAVFVKHGDVLVIAMHRIVVALDLKRDEYLWSLEPDTFPNIPLPVAYQDRLYLASGAKRRLTPLNRKGAAPNERVLRFPEDRSMGMLRVRPWGQDKSPWEELGTARGKVRIPANKAVWLQVLEEGAKDLSPVEELPPDAVFRLSLYRRRMTSEQFHLVTHLVGLRCLDFDQHSPPAVDPKGSFINDMQVISVGSLSNLETLSLSGGHVTDAGLKYLDGLRSLKELDLRGTLATQERVDRLRRDMPACRILYDPGTDAGIK